MLLLLSLFVSQEAEESHHNEQEKADQEKAEISHKLEEMVQQETSLSAKVVKLGLSRLKYYLPSVLLFFIV